MPIDDNIIDARVASLRTKIRDLDAQRQVLEGIEVRLVQVRTIESLRGSSEDPPTKEVPIDNQTGTRFTPNRRQAIYDQGVADADTALV